MPMLPKQQVDRGVDVNSGKPDAVKGEVLIPEKQDASFVHMG
jgi:hypothetical protein